MSSNISCEGQQGDLLFQFQWRLKALWSYLHSIGVSEMEFDLIWDRMEDAVIKTVLVAYSEMQADFRYVQSYKTLSVILFVL